MYNVTICNIGNVTLSIHGCFNISVEKLTCSNVTSKKQELFTFAGGVLNAKKVLIKNSVANDKMKYSKSEMKALLLIKESVAEIQNMLIKDSVVMSSVMLNNSTDGIINMKRVRNSFRNSLSLYRVDESNVKLCETKFHRNKIECLLFISRKSEVLKRKQSHWK